MQSGVPWKCSAIGLIQHLIIGLGRAVALQIMDVYTLP